MLAGALSLLYPAMCEERLPTAGVLYAATTRRIVAACSIGIWIGA